MSQTLNGIAAGGGITIAPVYVLGASSLTAPVKVTKDQNHEAQVLRDSFSLTRQDVQKIGRQVEKEPGHSIVTIQTLLEILDDPDIISLSTDMLVENHWTAAWTVQQLIDHLRKLSTIAVSSPFWANTVTDLGQRLLSHVLHKPIPDIANLDYRAVIIAHTITPTQMLRFDRQLVAAIVTDTGGSTSHFSLLSEEFAIPGVVVTHNVTKYAHDDMVAIVDGIHGRVILKPSPKEIDDYQKMAAQYAKEHNSLGKLKHHETITADGRHVRIAANLSVPKEIDSIADSGAEGVGLFLTEFMLMGNSHVVGEEEQFEAYKRVVTAMPERLVVIRTLDVGNDKTVTNIRYTEGKNPALSMRGIRLGLAHEEILRPQIRAVLRASAYGKIAIMFPLVSTVQEFRKARAIVDEERDDLKDAGVDVADDIQVGMMVETPAAVSMADQLAQDADFFSIGSNDLCQYLFAADRTNDDVNYLLKSLHPAMLRSILHVIRRAHTEGKWVSLCGEMAALPSAEPLLLAMGLDEFSVPSDDVLPLRHLISGLSIRQLQPVLHKALNMAKASKVEKLVKKSLPNLYQGDK